MWTAVLIGWDHRVHTEKQRPLSGVHSIMMEKFTQASEGGGARHPPSLYLPSRIKLQCTLQLSGQIHSPYFISTNRCTLWLRLRNTPPPSIWDHIRGRYWSNNDPLGETVANGDAPAQCSHDWSDPLGYPLSSHFTMYCKSPHPIGIRRSGRASSL